MAPLRPLRVPAVTTRAAILCLLLPHELVEFPESPNIMSIVYQLLDVSQFPFWCAEHRPDVPRNLFISFLHLLDIGKCCLILPVLS